MQLAEQTNRRRSFTVTTDKRHVPTSETWEQLSERIDAVPEDAQVRGMFLREVQRLNDDEKNGTRYVPFSMYPVREYMQLMVRTARSRYPHLSPPSALLELGLGVYDLFASSVAGVAVLSVAGSNFARVCEVSSRAYAITLKPGEARAEIQGPNQALMLLRQVWPFPEYFHCGIWLGVMNSCKVRGSIEAHRLSASAVDLSLCWDD